MAKAGAALSCTLAVLVAALAGCERKHTTSVEPAGVAWGEPVKGLGAGMEIKALKGDPEGRCSCAVTLENSADAPFLVLKSLNLGHLPEGVSISCEGKRLRYHGPRSPPMPALELMTSSFVRLGPGERIRLWGRFVPGHYAPEETSGSFTADLEFSYLSEERSCRARDPASGEWKTIEGIWTGTVRSGVVRLHVARGIRLKPAKIAATALVVLLAAFLIAFRVLRRRRAKAA